MAQIIVYAGAVMVLFIFVIMLLNAGAEDRAAAARGWRSCSAFPLLFAFLGLIWLFRAAHVSRTRATSSSATSRGGSRAGRRHALFTDYLLPFEVTSVLILIAILGAVVLARKEMD